MGLQWTAVATFLYVEIGVLVILCLPFISARRWQRIFHWGIWERLAKFWNRFFFTMIIILVVLLFDAVREVRKYSGAGDKQDAKLHPNAYDHLHMKLFRAQRNFYISGFSVFLWLVMRRVITLIDQLGTASSATAALQAQAEGANQAAKTYLQDNETLKQALAEGKRGAPTAEENQQLRDQLDQLRKELQSSEDALEKSQSEVSAMKKQSDGLTREYDRLLQEHQELQNLQEGEDGGGDKKEK